LLLTCEAIGCLESEYNPVECDLNSLSSLLSRCWL
jgi:hypothetical protein